ncbi:aspartate/glutamate racemase family protein [Stappia sp. BW2]|uniref:aspartate/glutamate racemase family protein n=1 Tax=Stappia sp. BW2 TaxID=2592622 RepID=UPI0019673CB6|nr:aspartate/glutamate racemase family protein [Stappia sp. BW2]
MPANGKSATHRLLVINPNTNPEVTRRISLHVLGDLPAGTSADVVNPDTGPQSIETAADRDFAIPAVLELIRQNGECDGYILACFDDIAVEEVRRMVNVPVISIAQAAIEDAAATGERYTVVTTVDKQVPTIEVLLKKYGAGGLGSVRACNVGVADASARTARAESLLDLQIMSAIEEDGAGIVVLGSGAYAGRANDLSAKYGVRFIEGLTDAVRRLSPARSLG